MNPSSQGSELSFQEGNRQDNTNGCSPLPTVAMPQDSQEHSKKEVTHLLLQADRVPRRRVLSSASQVCQVGSRGLRAILGAIGAAAIAAAEAAAQRLGLPGVQLQSMPNVSASKTTQFLRRLHPNSLQDNCRYTQQHSLSDYKW